MVEKSFPTRSEILEILRSVKDPEIDVIDVVELGVVRDATIEGDKIVVTITPTYSGCPALKMMEDGIISALREHGYDSIVKTTYNPPWTSDWMSDATREKLKSYGISPPAKPDALVQIGAKDSEEVLCPLCSGSNVKLESQFGSTACKALYTCFDCKQPFEYFKRF